MGDPGLPLHQLFDMDSEARGDLPCDFEDFLKKLLI